MCDWQEVYNIGGLRLPGQTDEQPFTFKAESTKWKGNGSINSTKESDWIMVKYHNSSGNESSDFKGITSTSGGVFMWVIKPKRMPLNCLSMVAYIGSSESNIKSTVAQFIQNGADEFANVEIKKLFNMYSEYLYLVYYENKDVSENRALSAELVEALNPPITIIPGTLSEKEDM